MTAFSMLYLRLQPDLKDRIVAAARRDGVSANEWAQETLRRALASGVGGSVSAGLAGSSAPVASEGALAEPGEPLSEGGIATRSGGLCSPVGEAVGHGLPGSANALTFVPPSLKQSVTTAGDLAKKQVTPHLKSEQAKGGKR